MIDLLEGIAADTLSASDPVRFSYENGRLTLRIKRLYCAEKASAFVYSDGSGEETAYETVYSGISRDRDSFSVPFIPDPGLYYVTFSIETPDGVFFVHSTGDEESGELRDDPVKCGRFQILAAEKGGEPDVSFRESNMYHIFVDRFRKTGKCPERGDAVYIDDWYGGVPEYTEYPGEDMENNTFFGGDLYGIAEKLPYIKSLGCDVVYLSPIFEAFSNHRYDTGDYMKIDDGVGGEKAFSLLCKKAHSLGMKIVLDGVFNHTGDHSRYFNKYGEYETVGAYNSKESEYFDWYEFREWPDDYRCWWGVRALPSLRHGCKPVYDLICGENGVIRKYLRMGADGWRIDVADELSDELLDGIKKAARAEKPGAIIIGEVWEDASNKISYGKRRHYFSKRQLDSVMDYPLRDAVINYALSGDCEKFRRVFTVIDKHYPDYIKPYLMNFLGSHDTERILTVLGGDPAGNLPGSVLVEKRMTKEQYAAASDSFVSAFALLCFCSGIACVYYGDEAGMQGYRDPFNRMPYPWGRENVKIRSAVGSLLNLRKRFTAPPVLEYSDNGVIIIRRGNFVLITNRSGGDVTVYTGMTAADTDGNLHTDVVHVKKDSFVILESTEEE